MEYKVYCDEHLIYSNRLETLKIFSARLSLALNNVSSFVFTIYPNHPYYEQLNTMKSIIKVYQDDMLIFRGRILNDESGFHNEKKVSCENDFGFLLDSIQRPYEFTGTPAELFEQFIETHNEQVDEQHKFIVGNVTVTDPNDYIIRSDSTYQNTFDAIQDKLIAGLGGYLWTRYEEDGTHIDYLADLNFSAQQNIEFGTNLLTLKQKVKADDVFTVIIPIGAMMQDSEGNDIGKLTIESVNDGKDYLENADAIELFGRIAKMVEWSDVTVATNLKNKAQTLLDNSVMLSHSIDLTAADIGSINANIECFRVGTKVKVVSKPHGINELFLVNKLSIDLLNPSNNKIQLGATYKSFTESQKYEQKTLSTQIVDKVEIATKDIIAKTNKQMSSSIQSNSSQILQTVSETYVAQGDINGIISQQTSQLAQDVNGWTQTWLKFQQTYADDKNGTDSQFELIEKYIRYVDGKIILGEVGNELELRIQNDRLGFYQNDSEVAYFSNNKLFVVDGEFTNSMQLGNFAFLPRTNGNLSFKKVRN